MDIFNSIMSVCILPLVIGWLVKEQMKMGQHINDLEFKLEHRTRPMVIERAKAFADAVHREIEKT